jgi:hypothetical protein
VIGGLIQINGQGGGEYPASCFQTEWEDDMPESAHDVILLIGSSKESGEKAAGNAGRLYAPIVVRVANAEGPGIAAGPFVFL